MASSRRAVPARNRSEQPLRVGLARRCQNLRRARLLVAVVRFISDEVLVMKDGVVVEQASAAQILAAPREAYTQRLLAAIPRGYSAAA